jgi:hypothetical protein
MDRGAKLERDKEEDIRWKQKELQRRLSKNNNLRGQSSNAASLSTNG